MPDRRPVLRRSLEPKWQAALRAAYMKEPDRLLEYLELVKLGSVKLDHRQLDELIGLIDRMLRHRGRARGRPPGIAPEHDRLHRLRADIMARVKRTLQALRQSPRGRVPYNGKKSALDEAFDHVVARYPDHNLTPRELAALKADIRTKI